MRTVRLLILLLACVLAGASFSDVPRPELARGKGERCVEPTEVIRRDHMRLLLHQRDETVHRGIRTRRHSLTGCIECHAARDDRGAFVSVNDPGQFCAACHAYAAVKLDCFECHGGTPDTSAQQP